MRIVLLIIVALGFAAQTSIGADPKTEEAEALRRALQDPTVDKLPLLLKAVQDASKCFPKPSEASLAVKRLGKKAVPEIVAQVKLRRSKTWTSQVDNLDLLAQIGPDAEEALPVLKEFVASPKTHIYIRHFAETAQAAIQEDVAALTRLAGTRVDYGDVALHAIEKLVAETRVAPKILELARTKKRNYLAARNAYQAKWKALGAKYNVDASRDDELTALSLGNDLTELPQEIERLKNLTYLDLSDNQFTEVPPEIGKLTNLTALLLGYNRLTGLPPEIGNLINLTQLNLLDNPITDAELEKLKTLKSLKYLYLTDTNATREGVAELQRALPNCKIKSDFKFDE
jgi:hypothetical protein